MTLATVTFTMMNGSVLECEYSFRRTPATYFEPSEFDAGEPTYSIDGKELDKDEMPKGLAEIACEMYEEGENSKFRYVEREPDSRYD